VKTKYFQILYYPIATIDIATRTEKSEPWLKYDFFIDSGADISAMNADDAIDLGVADFDSGQSINLMGVGQQPIEARIHKFDMSFNGIIIPEVRIAFVMNNQLRVPLLGRLDIFHYFDVHLKERARKTVFMH
jgi:hypothetical protein